VRFPLLVVLVCGGIFVSPHVGIALGLDPAPVFPYLMLTQLALPLGVLLLALWWLFFSGLPWLVRLVGVFIVAPAVAAGGYFSIRKVELTTTDVGMVPILHFIWEPTAQELYAAHRARESTNANDLPKIDATVGPEDFARYRGPRADGIVSHLKLFTEWNQRPPEVVWKHPCVEGYSGIAVAGNIIVTIEQRGDPKKEEPLRESIVCYDRATGRERWVHDSKVFYKDGMNMGDGPRSTPTIHDGRVFTVGATGQLTALTAEGKLLWEVNILEDSKAKNITWGLTGSPLIVGDLVVAHAGIDPDHPAAAGAALVAFEQATGKKRWAVGNRKAGYSSPQLATLAGVPQILLFDGEGLVSYDPATQAELWKFPWVTKMDMNMIQPVVVGTDRVFISSEPMENGAAMLRVQAPENDRSDWSVEAVWKNKSFGARFANPVTDGKRIFGLNGVVGVLTCLDANDGRLLWKGERCGAGQMLLVGDTLMVVTAKGIVSLFDPTADEAKELAQYKLLDSSTKTWNTPALAGDQLFVRNQREIACLKLPRR
jgi:outer membrane protein assembly factor BamB